MKSIIVLSLFQILAFTALAQSNEEIAETRGREAIKMMDEGKVEESIAILKECKKLDPDNYLYPYEIAYAHVLQKDYKKALKVAKKLKKYPFHNSQVYQISGNCYSYLDKPEKAVKEYEEGKKLFPNAGNLYLEKGNVFLYQERYDDAVESYEKGVAVDPDFPSNYYWLAKLFLHSSDKLSGLICGELFMNLERTTGRTQEISGLLYQTYDNSISLNKDSSRVDFCEVIMDVSNLQNMINAENLKLPFCAVFGKHFILATIGEEHINLKSLSGMRTRFLKSYLEEDAKDYPNVLFAYQKQLLDLVLFDAYNHYLLQMGAPEEFEAWLKKNGQAYDQFVDWYTKSENVIVISDENKFSR